jgi:hypothetical protein
MTPEQKAEKLVLKFMNLQEPNYNWFHKELGKKCALIAVDEMIQTAKDVFEHCWNHISWKAQYDIVDMNKYLCYLEEVKEEINKL